MRRLGGEGVIVLQIFIAVYLNPKPLVFLFIPGYLEIGGRTIYVMYIIMIDEGEALGGSGRTSSRCNMQWFERRGTARLRGILQNTIHIIRMPLV